MWQSVRKLVAAMSAPFDVAHRTSVALRLLYEIAESLAAPRLTLRQFATHNACVAPPHLRRAGSVSVSPDLH
jgi:hypothetical protein